MGTGKIVVKAALVRLLIAAGAVAAQDAGDPLYLVDTFHGTDGGGNTVPGASVPFGFVMLSPDTVNGSTNGYDGKSALMGFSFTHVSGTGGGSKFGNFRVFPAIGDGAWGNPAFPRADEQASPGLYRVSMGRPEERIGVELTATRLAGRTRFTFPATDQANVVLDASSVIPMMGGGQRTELATVDVADPRRLSGFATVQGGWGNGGYTLYFAAEFDRPATRIGRFKAGQGRFERIEGVGTSGGGDQRQDMLERLGAFATFDARTVRTVQLKLAVSFVSVEQARRNLAAEAPGWDFDRTAADARGKWRDALVRIKVEGGSDEQRRIFMSSLYRVHTMPHDLTGENVWWRSDEPHYEQFYAIWDTFRALHPLLTLIQPDRQRGMVRSLLDTYKHKGWLPDAQIAGATGPTQGGSNADVVVADAIVKDLGGFDRELAWAAILRNGEVQSPDPHNRGRELADYLRLGYMSLDQHRSASRTLEYAYNDFAIASVAAKLGHRADAARFLKRSANWRNLWDDQLGCVRPRYADGRWLENFDCDREYPDQAAPWWHTPFYEGSSRQYSSFVPHDAGWLMARLGGPEGLVRWLDVMFDGGHYTQHNEPDLLAPFLYAHAGRPDLTQRRVRDILARSYNDGRSGLPGNDDSGTMTSWYVWASMGLFPNAGQPFYYIASPVFTRSRIALERGRSFTIEAPQASDANRYVQSAELNGRSLDRAWLTHAEVAKGGRLTLRMGPGPSGWGRSAPPPDGVAALRAKLG